MGNLFSSKKQQDIYQSQFLYDLEQFIIKLKNLYVNNENCINNINISKNNAIINSILENDNELIQSLLNKNSNPTESANLFKKSIENILIGNKIQDNNVNDISIQICNILKTYYSNYTLLLHNIICIFKYLINRHSTLFTTRCNISNKTDKISMSELNYLKDLKSNIKNNLKNILVPKLLINSKELCNNNNGDFLMSYRQLVNNNLILLLFYEENLPISFSMILDNPTLPLKDNERKLINQHNTYLTKLKNIYDEYIEITLQLYKMANKILNFKNNFKDVINNNNVKFVFEEKYITSEKYNLYNRDLLNILFKIASIENKLSENIDDKSEFGSILNIKTTTDLNTLNSILSKNKFNKIYNIPENIKLIDENKIQYLNSETEYTNNTISVSSIYESKPRDYILVNKSIYDWFNEYKNKYQDEFYNTNYVNKFNTLSINLNNYILQNKDSYDVKLIKNIETIIKQYTPNELRNLNDINLTNSVIFFEQKYIKDNKFIDLLKNFSKEFIDNTNQFNESISFLIKNIKYNYVELSLNITKSQNIFNDNYDILNKIINLSLDIFKNKEYVELVIDYYKLVIEFLYLIISYNQYQNTLLINDFYEVQLDNKLEETKNNNDKNILKAKKLIKFLKSNPTDSEKKKDDIIDTINLFLKEIPQLDIDNFFKSYITDLSERLNINYLYLKYLLVDNYVPFNDNWLNLGIKILANDNNNYDEHRNFYNENIFKIYSIKHIVSYKSYFNLIYFYDELPNINNTGDINYHIRNLLTIIKNINDILNNNENATYYNEININLNKLLGSNEIYDYNLFLVNFIKYIANQFLNPLNNNTILDTNDILVSEIKKLLENFNYLSKSIIEKLNTKKDGLVKDLKVGGSNQDINENYKAKLIEQLKSKYVNTFKFKLTQDTVIKNINSIVNANDMLSLIRLKNNIKVDDLLTKKYTSPITLSISEPIFKDNFYIKKEES